MLKGAKTHFLNEEQAQSLRDKFVK